MCREIFKKIAERQLEGLMFHSDMADYYNFLNLSIFKKFHCKQYIKESKTFRKIKDHFIHKHHQTLLLDRIERINTVTPREWGDKTSKDVDEQTIKTLLKDSLNTYYNWEKDTHKFYKEAADELFEKGYYNDYCFVSCLAEGVGWEESNVMSLILDLSTVDYDITKMKSLPHKLKW